MTPKQKAKELVNKFKNRSIELGESHSQLLGEANALIAVDEVLFVLNEIDSTNQWNASYFYNQVKNEIEKL